MILLLLALTTVGSKQFTESVILGEIARQTLRQAGVEATHRRELGGTRVLWDALIKGEIDLYPEYTGTLAHELLQGATLESKGLADSGRDGGPQEKDEELGRGGSGCGSRWVRHQ